MLTKELCERYVRSSHVVRLPFAVGCCVGASCTAPPSQGNAAQGLPQDCPSPQYNNLTIEQMKAAPDVLCGDSLTRIGAAEKFMQQFATQGKFTKLMKELGKTNTTSFNPHHV